MIQECYKDVFDARLLNILWKYNFFSKNTIIVTKCIKIES